MKQLLFLAIIGCLLLGSAAWAQPTAGKGTLLVKISGLKNTDGQLRVYLFNSKDGFPSKPAKALTVRKEKPTGLEHVMSFSDLPFGTYAIAVHHDVNGNDKIAHNWLHFPKEPYGASNGARSAFGPPSFERAKFDFKADSQMVEVKVK